MLANDGSGIFLLARFGFSYQQRTHTGRASGLLTTRPPKTRAASVGGLLNIDPCTAMVVYGSMANGQVVLITTELPDGGPPVRSVYFVAEGDPAKAAAIVAAIMAPNERVEAWGPLPEAAVKALGLKPGDFTHG